MSERDSYKSQLITLFERVSGCSVSEFSDDQVDYLADMIEGQMDADEQAIEKLKRKVKQAKRQAIAELLALHEQDRAKVNSQCDTLINMSTVDKYLEGLE